MGRTTDIRRELKKVFLPTALQLGFVVDDQNMPDSMIFRRAAGNVVQIFALQWDKYGSPRFVLHFGTCPAEGLLVDGQFLAPSTVLPTWLPDSGSLKPRRGMSSRAWFRQDLPFLARLFSKAALRSPTEVVSEFMHLFSEVEEYWSSGRVGPHINLWNAAGR